MEGSAWRHVARRTMLVVSTMAAGLLLAGCGQSASVNYRMIVEVEDGSAVYRGSSVWRFKITENIPFGGPSFKPEFWGEAIAVAIPGKGTLFVLREGRGVAGNLYGNNPEMLPEHKFGKDVDALTNGQYVEGGRLRDITIIKTRFSGRVKKLECPNPFEMPASRRKDRLISDCLFMVRFRDINNPATVEAVDPADLEASFGPNVKLKRILIQITKDNVTTGIEKSLPWLPEYQEKKLKLSGRSSDVRRDPKTMHMLADQLGSGAFSTEIR